MKKVLVIVAHPDDETIWMGGSLIRNKKDWDTTLLCMCRKSDNDRHPKFLKACQILGVKPFIFDLDDENLKPIALEKYIDIIRQFSETDYDYLFTHGKNGEYGHIRHEELHKAVNEMINQKILRVRKIFFFSYLKESNDFQGYCICDSNANIFIKLNDDELVLKKSIIKDVYGYQDGGFEEQSSAGVESFLQLENEIEE